MAYDETDIRRVVDATDIVDLIGEVVALKRVGRRFVGLCPFHAENTGSFSVNPVEGRYYCFGCHAKGDAIEFVKQTSHVDFVDAVELLAARAHIVVESERRESPNREKRADLYRAYERAHQLYRETLIDPVKGERARLYLGERGITPQAIAHFGLGFAPAGQGVLSHALGLGRDAWEASGLGYVDQSGGLRDHMAGRVIFPIHDTSQRVVAFGGRYLPGEGDSSPAQVAKYKNSSDSPIYAKRRTLYSLNRARSSIVAQDCVVVCEGYTDVIALWQIGIENVVASCGTAFSEDHLEVLRRFTKNIVLLFDGDSAGQDAMERLWQAERSHGVVLAVGRLPAGLDPAEAAGKDPALLEAAIGAAVPMTRFLLDRLYATGEMETPEGRARTAEQAVSLVGRNPNTLVRSDYIAEIADRTGFSISELWARLPRQGKGGVPTQVRPEISVDVSDKAATETLRQLIHDPLELDGVIVPEMFRDPIMAQIVRLAEGCESLEALRKRVEGCEDERVVQLFYRLSHEPPEGASIDSLVVLVMREARWELQKTVRALKEGKDPDAVQKAVESVAFVKDRLTRLQVSRDDTDACGELIGWLALIRGESRGNE